MNTDIFPGTNPAEGNVKGQLVVAPNNTAAAEEPWPFQLKT